MSNVVKFPGQEDDPVPDNVVSFPDAKQRKACTPVRRGKGNPRKNRSFGTLCWSVVKVLFKAVRYAAAFVLFMAVAVPLGVLHSFKGLITFFGFVTSAILYWHDGLTYVHTAKVGAPTVYTFVTCMVLVVLAHSGKALAEWLAEKRIAFRLFGL
ncbi:hypothetical protein ALO82_200333 [Pseudomonas syringae pv. broussonetiae]|uniref:Uncharacterized protein n=1 Tax=Pseudomonas savastanoi TaxID=29438 RepID=A0A3M5J313_PSESS|nr:hypothetical protein [Pseudomonas savastanoi]KPW66676.1 hypothetical protein ALO82_200333 [Pseudomonas syringae pv. broussonetiae]KWS99809.1 hypothetical protein AL047_06440 [Pseudomonas syringae pv. broussonetiae]RMS29115.1 hypothetical protein ALP70_200083 [Pseudomonas savastanoi]RMT17581.1 hypothetical protein ALP51_200177 [Pseudomonas savastanoi]